MSLLFAPGGQTIGASASNDSDISPSNQYSGLISFRIDWFDFVVQGTLKSLPNTTVQKHQLFGAQLSYGPALRKNYRFD